MDKFQDKFTVGEIKEIVREIDDIQKFSIRYSSDEEWLMNIVDQISRVAGMFGDVIIQQLEDGYIHTGDPQDYIKKKLGSATIYKDKYIEHYPDRVKF
ncbi:hypothetical protein [Piscibacillus salipiscarius]|uniref:Uncharacterized protein n=1 Tax=Piscibacillus salipiscarius TaxID=299480 RepID=A0ABW5Q9C0_9BACI|nr:hypothetical protein [Piscibacillus salipiscarius]